MINLETVKGKFRIYKLVPSKISEAIYFICLEKGGHFVAEVADLEGFSGIVYTFTDIKKKAVGKEGDFLIVDETGKWEIIYSEKIGKKIMELMGAKNETQTQRQ